ncbi:hypothetical protein IID24_04250 [Patescibacteria group bacterium]|nr:hypothetical protein [Patescibacteria group bacterium]
MRVPLDELVEKLGGARIRSQEVDTFDVSNIRSPDWELVQVETASGSSYYLRKAGEKIEVLRHGQPRAGVETGQVQILDRLGSIRKGEQMRTDQFVTSPVTKITRIMVLSSTS